MRIDGLREQEARRCNERKAVDQELCETGGGGGGGDERGAEEEQAGRVVSRGGRGGGEESEARLQRRLVRGRLEQGRRRRRRRAEEGDAASARPSARRSGLQRCVLEMSTTFQGNISSVKKSSPGETAAPGGHPRRHSTRGTRTQSGMPQAQHNNPPQATQQPRSPLKSPRETTRERAEALTRPPPRGRQPRPAPAPIPPSSPPPRHRPRARSSP